MQKKLERISQMFTTVWVNPFIHKWCCSHWSKRLMKLIPHLCQCHHSRSISSQSCTLKNVGCITLYLYIIRYIYTNVQYVHKLVCVCNVRHVHLVVYTLSCDCSTYHGCWYKHLKYLIAQRYEVIGLASAAMTPLGDPCHPGQCTKKKTKHKWLE